MYSMHGKSKTETLKMEAINFQLSAVSGICNECSTEISIPYTPGPT